MSPEPRALRCAIYTRKSSEEGLEQSFNSLDAQREACESFVKSQRHEGWQMLPAHYDDGGYSGGTMDRPGLQKLAREFETKSLPRKRKACGWAATLRWDMTSRIENWK